MREVLLNGKGGEMASMRHWMSQLGVPMLARRRRPQMQGRPFPSCVCGQARKQAGWDFVSARVHLNVSLLS
jgi:hypothetical protein